MSLSDSYCPTPVRSTVRRCVNLSHFYLLPHNGMSYTKGGNSKCIDNISRTNGPILTNIGTKDPLVKTIQIFSNKVQYLFPKRDNRKIAN